jgi:hypothetical protein
MWCRIIASSGEADIPEGESPPLERCARRAADCNRESLAAPSALEGAVAGESREQPQNVLTQLPQTVGAFAVVLSTLVARAWVVVDGVVNT